MAKKSNIRRRTRKNSQESGSEAPAIKNGTKTTPSDDDDDAAPTLAVWWKGVAIIVVILAVIILFVWNFDNNNSAVVSEEASGRQSPSADSHDDSTSMDGSDYHVMQVLPHDVTAFTQGLTYFQGYLYETTGYHGKSQVRRVDPNTGQVLEAKKVDDQYFGEGVAHFIDKNGEACLIQLTWEEKTGFIYRISDLELLKTFHYETTNGQGWGITYDESKQEFIVSDGSSWLLFWDRDSLQEKKRVQVQLTRHEQGTTKTSPINHLNELEYYNGYVLSNVWYTNVILRIDPETGNVERIHHFDNIYKDRHEKADCFNGIALSEKTGELFVTGKWWPHLYRIKLFD
jgi:glutamine cyclotransferase